MEEAARYAKELQKWSLASCLPVMKEKRINKAEEAKAVIKLYLNEALLVLGVIIQIPEKEGVKNWRLEEQLKRKKERNEDLKYCYMVFSPWLEGKRNTMNSV
jgi:hypothetical protein